MTTVYYIYSAETNDILKSLKQTLSTQNKKIAFLTALAIGYTFLSEKKHKRDMDELNYKIFELTAKMEEMTTMKGE